VAANLPQARERSQHVDFAPGETFFIHCFLDLFAAAAQLGQVKFALRFAEFAIAAFLDSVRQILGHLALQAAQHEGTEFGGEAASSDPLLDGVLLARLIGLQKVAL
jgi:hypothetical protein